MSVSEQSMTESSTPEARSSRPGWIRLLLAVAAVIALYFLGREAGALVPRFADWVDGLGFWGPAAFVLGYAIGTVAFIPGSALTLAAGAIFGLGEGVAWVFLGASLGATAAFLVARYVARDWVEAKLRGDERFAAIDRAVGREGLKIVTLLRLSPLFPFNLLNYALGLTRVRMRDYVLACFGMLPGTLLYVYSGKLAGDVAAAAGGAAAETGVGVWVVRGLGLAATVVVTLIVTRTARRALKQEVDEDVIEERA